MATSPHSLSHAASWHGSESCRVVYSKRPFGGPEHALRYLGAYTHRVGISNSRLVSFADGQVSFRWRDSAHGNRKRVMSLPADEFLRRFLLHLVPRGFVRIRNFGFLANRQRAKLLPLCFSLLGSSAGRASAEDTASEPRSYVTLPRCPLCSGNHARHRALLLSPTACSLSTTACQVRCMNTQLKPRTQVMQQHASPVCASSRSHLRHPCHHACQMAQRSASDSVSPDSQSAQQLRIIRIIRYQAFRPAKPHPTPIEQRPRKKRLPSSRCIRTAPPRPAPMSAINKGRSRYSTKTSRCGCRFVLSERHFSVCVYRLCLLQALMW